MPRNEGYGRVRDESFIHDPQTGANNPRFEYLWQDSETYKKPTKMPAPEYIEHLMAWCQSNIDNESLFPSRIGRKAQLEIGERSLG